MNSVPFRPSRIALTAVVILTLVVLFPHDLVAGTTVLYEPVDGHTYFGFTLRFWDGPALTDPNFGDTRPFYQRYSDAIQVELSSRAPSIFAIPTIWQNADGSMVPFSETASIIGTFQSVSTTGVPLITWNAQSGWNNQLPYSGITTKTINSGSLDPYITQYAQDIRTYGLPVFVRLICGEVNGSWWANCSPRANPSLTAQDFVMAWKRVVDIFRQQGVTNVAWVWNVNTFPAAPADWNIDTAIANYYPGDSYVDWTSFDHYDYGNPSDPASNPLTPNIYLDPQYTFALAHTKPVMIPEWGVRVRGGLLTAAQQQQWLNLMFSYVAGHPRIKAVVYFNYNTNIFASTAGHTFLYNNQVNYMPNVSDGDIRLLAESGALFRQTFASAIITSGYVSTVYTNNPLNSAQFVAQQVPPTMIAGKTYPATVTMTNNGSSSNWTSDSNYALRNVASSAWAISQVALNPGEIVFPGNQKTFGFSVAAPSVAGNYDFRWRMTQAGNGDFGDFTPLSSIGVLPVASPNAYSAEYFDDVALTTLAAVRVDTSLDFSWGTEAPVAGMGADTFSARWTGDWSFPTSGKYRFTIVANDGVRVWVDGSIALNKWVNVSTATTYTFDKTLTAGVHRVKVEYYENTGAARAKLSWKLR